MKAQAISGTQFPVDPVIGQFIQYMILAWVIILFVGNLMTASFIAMGVIYWLTGWNPSRGKQMVVGGIVLFIAMQWIAFTTPLLPFLF
ncbi:MAG: hypothetical protein Q6364_06515 [Candidatus Hermodarchaeota archaeon]|nr:hypothetical protein [Candidatus Hermodarchaeota archaeon]